MHLYIPPNMYKLVYFDSLPMQLTLLFLLVQFENDIYVATSEPHGDIEAVVTRKDAMPHARL